MTSAADANRRVWMRYRGGSDETERAIDPYGVVHHRGRWYVVGWCHLRDDVRMFRLDRVLALEPREIEDNGTVVRATGRLRLRRLCAAVAGDRLDACRWKRAEIPLDEARRQMPPDLGTLEETTGGVILRTQSDNMADGPRPGPD